MCGALYLRHCLRAALLFWRRREAECFTSLREVRLCYGTHGVNSIRRQFGNSRDLRRAAGAATYMADMEEALPLDLYYIFRRGIGRCSYCQAHSAIRVLCTCH